MHTPRAIDVGDENMVHVDTIRIHVSAMCKGMSSYLKLHGMRTKASDHYHRVHLFPLAATVLVGTEEAAAVKAVEEAAAVGPAATAVIYLYWSVEATAEAAPTVLVGTEAAATVAVELAVAATAAAAVAAVVRSPQLCPGQSRKP